MKTRSLLFFLPITIVALACGADDDESSQPTQPSSSSSPSQPGDGASPGASSSSGGDAAPAGACEAAGTALCARACACATDGKCHFAVPTDAGFATINFESEQACRALYVGLGCLDGGQGGMDYPTCETKAKAAACVDSAGGRGAALPPECKTGTQ